MNFTKTLILASLVFLITVSCQKNPDMQPISEKAEATTHDVYGVEGQDYVADEVLVKFEPNTDRTEIAGIIKEMGLKKIKRFSTQNLYLLKIMDESTVPDVIDDLKRVEGVKYAEPNYIRRGYKK